MRPLRSLLCFAALAAAASACSLGLDFDPEGQPCDARNQCLTGYVCQTGYCVTSGTSGDGGTSSADGGTTGNATGCPESQDCSLPR
jgi:hypothetical protein